MAKNLKIHIKKEQIAKAIKLGGLKDKLAPKKKEPKEEETSRKEDPTLEKEGSEPIRRARARSKSVFAETSEEQKEILQPIEKEIEEEIEEPVQKEIEEEVIQEKPLKETVQEEVKEEIPTSEEKSVSEPVKKISSFQKGNEGLGPTGRHIKDFLPPAKPKEKKEESTPTPSVEETEAIKRKKEKEIYQEDELDLEGKKKAKGAKFKEFKDLKPTKRGEGKFDARDRQGLISTDDEETTRWRKRKAHKPIKIIEDATIRPTELSIRFPISIRDLASEMKLKSSELIAKLFLQGIVVTLNDLLDDETTVQLLGEEFGCKITIDTSEEKRIRITDQTIKEEIQKASLENLILRPPVVAFMGHVDHGKTSLIDAIRKSNRTAGEAGLITQHIGAFLCKTTVGDIAVLDTPGHEAFSAMRARGADVTDIVVLVVAGDEGFRAQTEEAIQHAKAAGVTIVVAINKSDKPNFNAENVYRELAEKELLPEIWGGQTITVNCSAVTGEGIQTLLEMLSLQSEILELKADPSARARGRVLESKMQKGLGPAATLLIQNGTLYPGDAVVFDLHFGRVKTMKDEFGKDLTEATPGTPAEISGLSGLPEAGQEFIVVANEKEAKDISEARMEEYKKKSLLQTRKPSLENLFQESKDTTKKILNIVLRADVQGSLEALKIALMKIESDKIELNIIFTGIGEISEADVQLAAASKAMILGFHTQIERHAENLVKELGVQVRTHDIIYHAIDDVKDIMTNLLDKIPQEEDRGKALVRATFKSSQFGIIAGCYVTEGNIHRNHKARLIRDGVCIWKGGLSSLRRVKEDVREVQKGVECGIVLNGTNDVKENDIIETYEITYLSQKL